MPEIQNTPIVFLSQNYKLDDFIKSDTATRLGINNTPPPSIISNLKTLVEKCLDPIWNAWHTQGRIIVHSGYRCLALNRAVGSKDSSDHVIGCAADIEIAGVSNVDLAKWVADNLHYNQVILEFYDPLEGPNSGWVHVAYHPDGSNKMQRLVINRHGTTTF